MLGLFWRARVKGHKVAPRKLLCRRSGDGSGERWKLVHRRSNCEKRAFELRLVTVSYSKMG
jgi:hypothetical protein